MRSHAKAPSAFTFGRKGFAAPALIALALCTLFALALASPVQAADRHIDSYFGPKPVGSPNTPGGVFGGQIPEIAIYTGEDANSANDKVFTIDARVQRFGAAQNSFERAWGKDVIAGNPHTGYEICVAPTTCKAGESGSAKGELSFSFGLAVDQADPALGGEGSLYVYDLFNRRVQKFDLDGNFILAFGDSVNQTTGGDVCTQASGDVCKAGSTGSGNAQFGSTNRNPNLAVDPITHDLYVADPGNRRIQQWSGTGEFERAFGLNVVPPGGAGNIATNEKQRLTVGATVGTYTLTFGANTTAALPIGATVGEVQTALNGLASVSTGGGSVAVTGGPGDTNGTTPYEIAFEGGHADKDVAQISINASSLQAGAGRTLTCTGGPTNGTTLSYQWLANGVSLGSANGAQTSTYTVQAADAGKAIQCQVTATNSPSANTGSTQVSNPATIVDPLPAPAPPTAPTGSISSPSGTVAAGNALTCNAGTWGNSPTSYTYAWLRNGTQVLETETKAITSDTYTLTAGDVSSPASYQCLVTGTNAGGSVSKASQNRSSSPSPSPSAPTASASVPALATTATIVHGASAFETCTANCQAGSTASIGTPSGQFAENQPRQIAVDSNGIVYASDGAEGAQNNRLLRFDSKEALATDLPEPPVLAALEGGPLLNGITMGLEASGDHVFVMRLRENGLETRVQELNPAGTAILSSSPPAADVGQLSRSGLNDERVRGFAVNSVDGRLYVPVSGTSTTPPDNSGFGSCPHPESSAPNASKICHGYFILDADGVNPPTVAVGAPSGVSESAATLEATINPAGTASYRFEYSKNGVDWTAASADIPVSGSSQTISQSITGLEPNTLYRVRLATLKLHGVEQAAVKTATSAEATFVTDALPPQATTFSTSRYDASSATLGGEVDPNGSPTTYRFEWGKSTSYGFKVPSPAASVGAGTNPKALTAEISGLQPGTTYHYRLCAESPQGQVCGVDKAFTTLANFGPPAPTRAWEMVTPPFKALPQFGGQSQFGDNPNPGIPSLDGEAMMWANSHFPLSDEVDSPNSGDTRLMRRTAGGWTFETRNTLSMRERCNTCVPGESIAPVFARVYASATSGDMEAVSYMLGSGGNPEFLPSEGPLANRLYTRRDGTGVEGWTPWLTNASEQVGTNQGDYSSGGNAIDDARFDDDGSAMARWWFYRDLAEDPEVPGDDDPSDQQLRDPSLQFGVFGQPGGRTVYVQRAESPQDMPSAPKDLVNECTGSGSGDGTQLPTRVGSGAATDTIGTRGCWSSPGVPEATGTGTVSAGSNTVTSLGTDTGAFAVGQIVKGPGIPPSTQITAVNSGAGTLTLSAANTSSPKATGSGIVTNGSNVITGFSVGKGEFEVGQVVTVSIEEFFIFIPPFDVTVTAVAPGSLTISTSISGLLFGSAGANVAANQFPGSALEADSVHVTSVRGATLGSGGGTEQANENLFSQTAMSEDADRVFFQSPDTSPSTNLPTTGCTSATAAATTCVSQLYVRQYAEDGTPTVRWISRAQGVGPQRVAEMGRGAQFEGASRDGRYVYFRTNSPLLPSDPNGGNPITNGAASDKSFDLYRYELPEDLGEDPANGTLTRISGGPSGSADPSTNNADALGTGLIAQPVGSGGALRYLADDGELAYFVTTSPIAGADSTPPQGVSTSPGGAIGNGTSSSGTRNLYLFDHSGSSPQWRYVASLPFSVDRRASAGSAALNACASFELPVANLGAFSSGSRNTVGIAPMRGNCFRGTPDGKHVLFQTAGRLTGDDTDDASDLYLYDYERDELTRITAPSPGAAPYRCNVDLTTGEFLDGYCNGDLGLNISGDGQPLATGQGTNSTGGLANARGWGGGRYYNLTTNPDGTVSVFFQSKSNLVPEDNDTLGRHDVYEWREGKLTLMTPEFPEMPFWYSGSSLDGEDLFVNTPARIDPRELDDNDHDIYDLRVGGGFPYTPPPTSCDVLAHECRSTAAPNPEPRTSASATFSGEGNLTQKAKGKPRRCGKGKVRVKGRCVAKKSSKRAKKTTRRAAGNNGRTGR